MQIEGIAPAGFNTAVNPVVVTTGDASINTELPAAAALADAAANPTTPTVGSALLGFNGTTFDRLRSDTTNGLDVDVTRVTGTVTTAPGDSSKTTYSTAIVALAPVAAATDIFEISGSATKTVKVRRIQISGVATAAGAYDFALIKRSAANTVGTSTSPAAIPHDSADAAGTAVVKAYTANPTLGAAVGTIRAVKATVSTVAGAIPNILTTFDFGVRSSEPVVLRGVAQSLCINLGATTMTGGSLDIDVEWTEE